MDIKKFLSGHTGILMENRIYRLVMVLMLLLNLVLVIMLNRNQTVVLVPPMLKAEAKVSMNNADRSYIESWGLFFATLMGNVTPRNIDFILEALQRYMAPDIYQELTQAMAEQAKAIKGSNLTITFSIQEVAYSEETKRVTIKGQTIMQGPFGKSQKANRSYDLAIDISNYAPVITDVSVLDQNQAGEEKQ